MTRDSPAPDASAPVLEFVAAHVPLAPGGSVEADMVCGAGDLVLVVLDDPQVADAVVDTICGLTPPRWGTVRILGHRWEQLSAGQANALRGRIGRVSSTPVFPASMTVGDDVALAALYHTRRGEHDVMTDAARLATAFGLPGLPLHPPGEMDAPDLIRAECVRALLDSPNLLVIDERTNGFPDELTGMLINATHSVRARGGAVLWLTDDASRQDDARLPATQRFALRGGRFEPLRRTVGSEAG